MLRLHTIIAELFVNYVALEHLSLCHIMLQTHVRSLKILQPMILCYRLKSTINVHDLKIPHLER